MRAYIASMLAALVFVVLYVSATEGFLHDEAWQEDCAALARGEAVQSSGSDHEGFLENC